MPEIRYYTVTQEREVKVWANSPTDAALIADSKFNGHMLQDVDGDATTNVRELSLAVKEDR